MAIDSVGLTAFLAVTALTAGPDFIQGLQKSGVSLVVAGLALVIVPELDALVRGQTSLQDASRDTPECVLRRRSVRSIPAAVQEAAKSKIPTLGYGVTYAVVMCSSPFGEQ